MVDGVDLSLCAEIDFASKATNRNPVSWAVLMCASARRDIRCTTRNGSYQRKYFAPSVATQQGIGFFEDACPFQAAFIREGGAFERVV